MNTRQFARRAMATLAAVTFAASLALVNPSAAFADGSGGNPPPPPDPGKAPYTVTVTVAYSLIYVTAVL